VGNTQPGNPDADCSLLAVCYWRGVFMQMKKIVFLFLTACCILSPAADGMQNISTSDTRISLLTSAPGEELYAAFGHSAVRLKNDLAGYDFVFNYGVFSFNEPNFYINFARGRMNYYLDVQPFERFLRSYIYENRSVYEQVFEMDSVQKDFVVKFLLNNSKPENRYYLYHFFLDNCATRIRDLMTQAYGGLILPPAGENPTYRELVHACLEKHPWGKFAIDIALGLPTDQKTDAREQMFLPDRLAEVFAGADYKGKGIIGETRGIFVSEIPAIPPPGPVTPVVVCGMIFLLSVFFCFKDKVAVFFDFTLFFVAGLTGLLIVFLWFFTDHTNTQNNLNIIWALPSHALMAFFLLRKKSNAFTRNYFLVTAVIAVLLLISWALLPQTLNPALIPLTLSIAVRAWWNSRTRRFPHH
jgi:hypothetical protein